MERKILKSCASRSVDTVHISYANGTWPGFQFCFHIQGEGGVSNALQHIYQIT